MSNILRTYTIPDHDINEAILMCLCYFDVFQYPMKREQIKFFLPYVLPDETDMEHRLRSGPLAKLVSSKEGYFFLNGRDPDIVKERHQQEQFAKKRWRIARFMAGIIKMFPYVRAVFVSGNLSKNLSRRDSDIDFFILTSPGKLWIARFLLTAFKKIFLLNKRTFFCINYFRSTDYLKFDDAQSFFTAVELLTLKPVYNGCYYEKILLENGWINPIFPNHSNARLNPGLRSGSTNGFAPAGCSGKTNELASSGSAGKTNGFATGGSAGKTNGLASSGSALKTNGFACYSSESIENSFISGRFSKRRSMVQVILEGILRVFDTGKWDACFMKHMQRHWSRKYPETPEIVVESQKKAVHPSTPKPHKYRISRNESAALGEDSEQAVMDQFQSRFNHYLKKLREIP